MLKLSVIIVALCLNSAYAQISFPSTNGTFPTTTPFPSTNGSIPTFPTTNTTRFTSNGTFPTTPFPSTNGSFPTTQFINNTTTFPWSTGTIPVTNTTRFPSTNGSFPTTQFINNTTTFPSSTGTIPVTNTTRFPSTNGSFPTTSSYNYTTWNPWSNGTYPTTSSYNYTTWNPWTTTQSYNYTTWFPTHFPTTVPSNFFNSSLMHEIAVLFLTHNLHQFVYYNSTTHNLAVNVTYLLHSPDYIRYAVQLLKDYGYLSNFSSIFPHKPENENGNEHDDSDDREDHDAGRDEFDRNGGRNDDGKIIIVINQNFEGRTNGFAVHKPKQNDINNRRSNGNKYKRPVF